MVLPFENALVATLRFSNTAVWLLGLCECAIKIPVQFSLLFVKYVC